MTKVYASYVCVRDRLLHTFFSCVRDTPILIGFKFLGVAIPEFVCVIITGLEVSVREYFVED